MFHVVIIKVNVDRSSSYLRYVGNMKYESHAYLIGIMSKISNISNIEISGLRYQLRYRLKVVLYYCFEDFIILMIDALNDPIKHLPIKNETLWNEYVKNIVFRIKIPHKGSLL